MIIRLDYPQQPLTPGTFCRLLAEQGYYREEGAEEKPNDKNKLKGE